MRKTKKYILKDTMESAEVLADIERIFLARLNFDENYDYITADEKDFPKIEKMLKPLM